MKKGNLRHLDFIIIDICSIEIALAASFLISMLLFSYSVLDFGLLYILIPLIHLAVHTALDPYNGILQRGYFQELKALLKLEFLIFSLLIILLYFFHFLPNMPRSILIIYFSICCPFTYLFRFIHKFHLRRRYLNVKYSRQIVVATTYDNACRMIQSITRSAIRNYQFFGLAILDRSMIGEKIDTVTVSADRSTLTKYLQDNIVDEVFINMPDQIAETLQLTNELLAMGITAHIYMEQAYDSLPNRSIGNMFGYNVLTTTISPISFRQSLLKRIFDILGGIFGCLITVILTIFIGPIIYIKSPGPIFFSQIRIGKAGRPFKIYKFRSMYMDAEARKQELMAQNKISDGLMFKMDDDPRIIKGIGTFIRKTSLDEFPQFWNVLKGDMSMVGTRPPTVDEYQRYSPHHKRRLSILPGITGLWQISGRSTITDFEEVVRLDTTYIENWSVELDLKIILKTIQKIWKNQDAS